MWAAKAQVTARMPASEGANTKLTISGGVEKTETAETDTEETESSAGGSLTISDTTGGLVMADGSDVEITDGANVTIEETKTSGSTQAGRGVTQRGKTGYTGEAGLCLASLAEVKGREYILVTAGAGGNHSTAPYHIEDAVTVYRRVSRGS